MFLTEQRAWLRAGACIAAVLFLAGCGRVSARGTALVPPPEPSVAPIALQPPIPMDLPAVAPSPRGPSVPPGACDPLAGCDVHAQLVVSGVEKKKSGFMWRKLRIKGTVTNRGGQPLDGEVVVRFKKGGEVVQSEFVALAAMAPGQGRGFEMVSAVAADDVEVTSRVL